MNKFFCLMASVLALSLSGCDKDQEEHGLALSILMPEEDTSGEIRTWIYKEDGALVKDTTFATPLELTSTLIDLAAGKYEIIAANNLTAPFSTDQVIANGTLPYERLLFRLDDAAASPAHAHYGVQTVTVTDEQTVTRAEVKMNRILAEVLVKINNVPSNVVSADWKITNTAKAFLPYSSLLLPETAVAELGNVTPKDGVITFGTVRVMPVSEAKTHFVFTFHYADGTSVSVEVNADTLQNGGIYSTDINHSTLKPGMEITVSLINSWKEGGTLHGEILNPDN